MHAHPDLELVMNHNSETRPEVHGGAFQCSCTHQMHAQRFDKVITLSPSWPYSATDVLSYVKNMAAGVQHD